MTIPTFVTDWIASNGWEQKMNIDRVVVFEKDVRTIHIDNIVKASELHLRCYKFQADQGLFSFLIPSNEQDFLTLMKILLK